MLPIYPPSCGVLPHGTPDSNVHDRRGDAGVGVRRGESGTPRRHRVHHGRHPAGHPQRGCVPRGREGLPALDRRAGGSLIEQLPRSTPRWFLAAGRASSILFRR